VIQLKPQLTFEESLHRYYRDGVWLPSVTAVLQSAGLIDYDFLSAEDRPRAMERGRDVHRAAQQHDEGSLAEETVPDEIRAYLRGWRAFRQDYGFQPTLVEHRVYNLRHGYAGCIDRTGRTRDGSEIIVDVKTGVAPAWTSVQLAAYADCLPHPRTHLRRAVELHRNGTYKVIPYETSDYQRDLDTFARALETFRAKEEK
jgi:hypothetical protein